MMRRPNLLSKTGVECRSVFAILLRFLADLTWAKRKIYSLVLLYVYVCVYHFYSPQLFINMCQILETQMPV